MSPDRTAFTIWCIAGSSVGAPALFRAQMAGRAAWLTKALALPAGSCWAAACASCAFVTASATGPRTAGSCARRRALACSGLSPRWRGMVLRALQSAAAGGGQGANTCDRCAMDVGSRRCTWIRRRAVPARPARPCEGACAPRCAGAKPPLPCVCAGPREVRARGTRPPGSTALTCPCPSPLWRIPRRIPRRGGRCVGGGRAATRGLDGGARGRPTAGKGGPGALAGGHERGAGSPCRASAAGPSATCRRGESPGRGRRR